MNAAIVGLAAVLLGALQDRGEVEAQLKRDGWKAVRDLVERGDGARPALEAARASRDPDVAFLAAAARAEMEFYAQGDLRLAPPTRGFEGPASAAAAELFRAAGLPVEEGILPGRRASLPAGLSLAEALERLSRDLDVEFVPRPEGPWTPEGTFRKVPRFASGRALAALTEWRTWSGRELGRDTARSLAFSGELRLLGRLSKPVLYGDLRILEAADDRGADLRTGGDDPQFHVSEEHSGSLAHFGGSLRPLSAGATRIGRLRFAADLALAGKRDDLVWPLAGEVADVKRSVGDVSAVLKRAFWEDGDFHVEISIRARALDRRFREEDLQLLDADGKPWTRRGHSGGSGNDGLDWEVRFSNPGDRGAPARLVGSVVAEASLRSVYFEIPGFEPP